VQQNLNDIDDLIGKVLAGEASAAEQEQLQAWSDLSAGNKQYLDQIRTIFEMAASRQVQLHFDTDAAWHKVKKALKNEKNTGISLQRSFNFWPALKIAAGIIFIVTIGIFSFRWWNQPVQTFAVSTDRQAAQDTLPDGSTAFLNKKSSLTYEYNRRKKTRTVRLKGEGFFEVKHEEAKPFIIEAEEVLVRDIGTAFNVRAYPESDTVAVVVKTGEVQIYTNENAGLHLTAGETGIYSKRRGEFTRLEKADTNVLSYKTGVFSFNHTDLKTVIEKINEVYDSHIILQNPALATCRLTVNFQGESLDAMVEVIAETFKLTVTRKDQEIILNGAGCN
jgi:transmembrane sensor